VILTLGFVVVVVPVVVDEAVSVDVVEEATRLVVVETAPFGGVEAA